MSLEEDFDVPPLGVYHTAGGGSGRRRDFAIGVLHGGFDEKNACFPMLVKVQLHESGAASH